MASHFSKDAKINVTLIASHELQNKADKIMTPYNNFNFYPLPHALNQSYPQLQKHVVFEMYDIQKYFTTKYMRDDLSLL